MKKLWYLLLFNSIFWNYGQAQVFQEDFQTISPLYPYSGCPSISFKNQDNALIDCLTNWRIYKGTPSIGTESGNSYLSISSINIVGKEFYEVTESAYLNGYKLRPNTNYRLVYYVKATPLNNVNGSRSLIVGLMSGQMTPDYYNPLRDGCGYKINTDVFGRKLEVVNIPQNGIPEWEARTIYFSTENEGEYTLLFTPLSPVYNAYSVAQQVFIDNVSLYEEGECESRTVYVQNTTITSTSMFPGPMLRGKRIYAGNHVEGLATYGDVVVKPNGILNLNSTYKIDLEYGFIVEEGGIFDASVDGSCYQGNGTYKTASEENEVVKEIMRDDGTETSNKITIYPNPSNGQFILSATTDIDEIVIYNALGQEVKGIVDSKNKLMVEVNLMNKVKGVYFLKIRSGNEWTDKKISIE